MCVRRQAPADPSHLLCNAKSDLAHLVTTHHSSSPFHLDIPPSLLLIHIPEQVAAFEVLVGVHDGLELRGRHDAVVPRPFQFRLVEVFKHAVTTKLAYVVL